jgi:SPP1 gp7 family putative phage head morphogenesis protein
VKQVELAPVREQSSDFDKLEKILLDLFRREIYLPILKELGANKDVLQNANPTKSLVDALQFGRIRFQRGKFTGKLTAEITKDLRALGAKWDSKAKAYSLPRGELPEDLKIAIAAADSRMQATIKSIDARLAAIDSFAVQDNFKIAKFFDTTLWKTDQRIKESFKKLVVGPDLTADQRKISENVLSGKRYENMEKVIRKSYGVTERKAKFLARQETGIMMAQFKKIRYTDAGIQKYKWRCVVGSPNHPVRKMHERLNGTTQFFSEPPITDNKGNRNNPGEDYNCRCTAIPIVTFSK